MTVAHTCNCDFDFRELGSGTWLDFTSYAVPAGAELSLTADNVVRLELRGRPATNENAIDNVSVTLLGTVGVEQRTWGAVKSLFR